MIEDILTTHGILVIVLLAVACVLAFLMPIFVFTIRLYVVRIDKKMDTIIELLKEITSKTIE